MITSENLIQDDNFPPQKEDYVEIRIRTEEQANYVRSLGKQIFTKQIKNPKAKQIMEYYYCLMDFNNAIKNCL